MKQRTVLLVEDNPQDEALTLRAFRKAGITNEVIVMRDGAEALDYLLCTGAFADRDPTDLPTVVLMDLNLPKISGLEAVRRIRANDSTKLLPVVILTSSDEDEDRIKGYECGANSYVAQARGVRRVRTGAFADRGPDGPMPTAVVLLDLNLPKVGGLEVMKRIRANGETKRLPVVILTSSDEDEDRLRGYEEAGANSYVRKPVEFGAFAAAVQQLGLYWLILNELVPAPSGTPVVHGS